jgi:hypothetical protein
LIFVFVILIHAAKHIGALVGLRGFDAHAEHGKTGAMLLLPFHNESHLDYRSVFNNVAVFYFGGTHSDVCTLYIRYCLGRFF